MSVRAITLDELEELGNRIRTYCRHQIVDEDGVVHPKQGPRPGADLEDILMVMLATGARIGEVLALTWPQVDLDSAIARVTIDATLIVPQVATERLFRQEYLKGDSPPLTLMLPLFAADGLRRRREQPTYYNPADSVFVTATGNWVSPNNVRRSWRAARGDDFDWVTPHTLRKMVATLVKETYAVEAAQMQLGHANTRVAEAHYIQLYQRTRLDRSTRLFGSKRWIAPSPKKTKHPATGFTLVTGRFWVRHQGLEPRTR